jgi:hypothetical protein
MPRMRIISQTAQSGFDRPPEFDFKDRKRAFDLPLHLIEQAKALRTPSGKIGFLIQCAYFKHSRKFFLPTEYHDRDIEAASRLVKLKSKDFMPASYAKASRLRHQRKILGFHGFQPFDSNAAKALQVDIDTMARLHLKPRLIFERCVDFLEQKRSQNPFAYRLIELIRTGLHARKAELVEAMNTQLSAEPRALLDGLFATADESRRYRLTLTYLLGFAFGPRIKALAKQSLYHFRSYDRDERKRLEDWPGQIRQRGADHRELGSTAATGHDHQTQRKYRL